MINIGFLVKNYKSVPDAEVAYSGRVRLPTNSKSNGEFFITISSIN